MEVTDTSHETRGFPPIEPIDASPEMARFMTAMRRLQDIAVSTAPDGELWTDGAQRIEELCEELEVHRAPQGVAPARRAPHLPDEPLVSRGRIDRIDGRKTFLTATMTDADGTVLSEANGLMVKLLPHQP